MSAKNALLLQFSKVHFHETGGRARCAMISASVPKMLASKNHGCKHEHANCAVKSVPVLSMHGRK